MAFLCSLLLSLVYPTSLALLLLLLSATLKKLELPRRIFFWLAIAVILICGNGWLAKYSIRYLEREYPPLNSSTTGKNRDAKGEGMPMAASSTTQSFIADCIVVLGGATLPKTPPRPTVQVSRAGDRVLYAAELFRQGKAPLIICSGKAMGGAGQRPAAEDMAELLEMLGIPEQAILTETQSGTTYQHTIYLPPLLRQRGFKRVLLVTSAMHMPRTMLVFRKQCPDIDFVPAPTDFRITDTTPSPWYHEIFALIPVPDNLVMFNGAMHEYCGILYYKLRGWI